MGDDKKDDIIRTVIFIIVLVGIVLLVARCGFQPPEAPPFY